MQLIVLLLGTFIEQISIMLITLPIYIPIVQALGFDTIWFGVLMLINLQMALTTPPFGMLLFVMKGVAPATTTMREIYTSAIPFLLCDTVAMALVLIFPELTDFLQDMVYTKR